MSTSQYFFNTSRVVALYADTGISPPVIVNISVSTRLPGKPENSPFTGMVATACPAGITTEPEFTMVYWLPAAAPVGDDTVYVTVRSTFSTVVEPMVRLYTEAGSS